VTPLKKRSPPERSRRSGGNSSESIFKIAKFWPPSSSLKKEGVSGCQKYLARQLGSLSPLIAALDFSDRLAISEKHELVVRVNLTRQFTKANADRFVPCGPWSSKGI